MISVHSGSFGCGSLKTDRDGGRDGGGGSKCVSKLFFFLFSLSFSSCVFVASAPEEEGARRAAGGRDPGLREDSHGEEQPPEGPGQDGQRLFFFSGSLCYARVASLFHRQE